MSQSASVRSSSALCGGGVGRDTIVQEFMHSKQSTLTAQRTTSSQRGRSTALLPLDRQPSTNELLTLKIVYYRTAVKELPTLKLVY